MQRVKVLNNRILKQDTAFKAQTRHPDLLTDFDISSNKIPLSHETLDTHVLPSTQ